MHHCLEISEVVRCVASYMDGGNAYHLAITCKSLLEPCLDEVWRQVGSFEPLISCLPDDLWSDAGTQPHGDDTVTILELQRDLKPTDIHKYVTYYAPRIESFALSIFGGTRAPSIQALRSLQLLTRCRPGALSPKLKTFVWYSESVDELIILAGSDYALQFSPTYISLFMGAQVETFWGGLGAEDPVSLKAAVHSGMQLCEASLREVWIVGGEFIGRCLESFSWQKLDTLTVHYLDVALLPQLSALPLLRNLTMVNSVVATAPPSRILCSSPESSSKTFKSLRSLKYSMPASEFNIRQMLPYIPRTKAMLSLEWDLGRMGVSIATFQEFLDTLEEHADCMGLTHLKIRSNIWRWSHPEVLDVGPQRINFSPVRVFGDLETFHIDTSHSLFVTPRVMADIPNWWPRLRQLHLCPHLWSSSSPSINHTHILDLSQRLPNLEVLGTQFDATWITGEEGIIGQPGRLRKLLVGRSPICSPSAVLSFLNSSFPKLESLDNHYITRPGDDGLFKKRWQLVVEGLS